MVSFIWFTNFKYKNIIMYYIVELFNNFHLNKLVKIKNDQDLYNYISEADKVVVFSTKMSPKVFDISIQTKNDEDSLIFAKLLEYSANTGLKSLNLNINLFIKIHYNKFSQVIHKINNSNA